MVQNLFEIEKAIKEYIRILETKEIYVSKVILYGSHAHGTPHDGSDVDIVVVSPDLDRFSFPERLSFLSRATLPIQIPLEVIGYTPQEIKGKEGKSIFWDEICSTGQILFDKAA